jgi:hypothetical protein
MKWIDVRLTQPAHNQEVIVYYGKKHDLAIYDKESGGFRLRNGSLMFPGDMEIFWSQLIKP